MMNEEPPPDYETVTVTRHPTGLSINPEYPRTIPGIIKITEMVNFLKFSSLSYFGFGVLWNSGYILGTQMEGSRFDIGASCCGTTLSKIFNLWLALNLLPLNLCCCPGL